MTGAGAGGVRCVAVAAGPAATGVRLPVLTAYSAADGVVSGGGRYESTARMLWEAAR